jgi:hypothetical protein
MSLMKVIGQAMAQFLSEHANDSKRPMFSYDPVDEQGRDLLVTKAGKIGEISARLGDPNWLATRDD